MSTDSIIPLFEISDNDDLSYEDDPVITQAKANLAAAERVQQERGEQRRLEREEWKAWAEVERLMWEIEEAELEWLTLEKERLEEETHTEQQHVAVLCGSERAVEQH